MSSFSTFSTEKGLNIKCKFNCEKCAFTTSKNYAWLRHLNTRKHTFNGNPLSFNGVEKGETDSIMCNNCHKKYKDRSGLWHHRKGGCVQTDPSNNSAIIIDVVKNTQEFQYFLMEQNNEYKNYIIEQNKKMIEQLAEKDNIIQELSTKTNIIQANSQNNNTNSHNKFNINFFLNEKCKDAMNITDFVNSLQLKISDLDTTCDKGYIEGISQIVIRGLKELDIYKRPIHCSDLKRETIFLKNPDGWEKENESKEKLRKMIGTIANKNIDQTDDWVKAHPSCKNWNDKNNTRYIRVVSASMGGENKEEDEKFMNKIIHNVAKEVVIQKE